MATFKPLDDRQVENRAALSTSIGTAANTTLDVIFSTIDGVMVNLAGAQNITNKTIGTSSSNVIANTLQFIELTATPSTNPPSGDLAIYPKTNGFFYVLNSSGVETELGSFVPVAPTVQKFTGIQYYTFTVTALTVQTLTGAIYTNNTFQYTVVTTANIGATTLVCSTPATPNAPTSSGTLTLFSGTGQTSIAFSSAASGGTYQRPTNPTPLYIRVRMIGGGGGGSGSGSSGAGSGGSGVNTVFGTSLLSAFAGNGGTFVAGGGGQGGLGGGSSIGTLASGIALTGGAGGCGSVTGLAGAYYGGANGASTPFGGEGLGGPVGSGAGGTGQLNTGAGGGGGGGNPSIDNGSGGGAGGYVDAIVTNPLSTYSFSVGAGGSGGSNGTGGSTGGTGGSGIIIVDEYYQ